jgi:uncharacterized repeat protein (TIGR03943 family)
VSAAGGLITLLVGTVLLRLTLQGTYSRYVRVGMGPWLLVAGAVVVAVGVATLVVSLRQAGRDHEAAADAHGHGGQPMGWLLLAPIAALLLVAPPTLGSFGVDRGARVDIRGGGQVLPPLRPSSGPVPMTLLEYGQRALDHDGASFNGATVRLTGFVAGTEPDGFRLARYQIACCAADAVPVVLRVVGARDVPARDQWVTVTGAFEPGGGQVPEVVASNVVPIRPPEDPYE